MGLEPNNEYCITHAWSPSWPHGPEILEFHDTSCQDTVIGAADAGVLPWKDACAAHSVDVLVEAAIYLTSVGKQMK